MTRDHRRFDVHRLQIELMFHAHSFEDGVHVIPDGVFVSCVPRRPRIKGSAFERSDIT